MAGKDTFKLQLQMVENDKSRNRIARVIRMQSAQATRSKSSKVEIFPNAIYDSH